MTDSDLDRLFGDLAEAQLPVPETAKVLARGRQRRRQHRLLASLAVVATAAVLASTAGYAHDLAERGSATAGQAGHGRRAMLPAGSGQLLLGLGSAGSEFMLASASDPTRTLRLTSLQPLAGGLSQIAADPAGGWVVSYAPAWSTSEPIQQAALATVSSSGAVHLFGPSSFGITQTVTSLAVRPDGAAVAVALTRLGSNGQRLPAAIELLPLPGQHAARRTWTLGSPDATEVRSLSWAPGGTGLTYIPGGPTGGGFSGHGAVTLDTAVAGSTAPARSAWPRFAKTPGSCNINAGTWSGATYVALEQCTGTGEVLRAASARDGASTQPGLQVPAYLGCGDPQLEPSQAGGKVLISGCGLEVSNGDRVAVLLGQLAAAAWAG